MIFKNYVKIVLRNIQNHTSYALINILGLSTALTASLVICLYSLNILRYDDHHEEKNKIFLTFKERLTPDGTQATYDTWVPLAERLRSEYPVINASALRATSEERVVVDDRCIQEQITYSEPALFQIFNFNFLLGNEENALDLVNDMVISSTVAEKYFPFQDPVGKELSVFIASDDTTIRYTVSAVFEDLPQNSSILADIIVPVQSVPDYQRFVNNWDNSFLETWVLLNDRQDREKLEADFPDLITRIWDEETASRTHFKLLPLSDYYDTFIGDSDNARIMLLIALGIMMIASINFMNLATARSSYRSKEIGLRKVLGAITAQIRVQFLVESIIYTLLSMMIAMTLLFFTLPYVNIYFDLQLSFSTLIGWDGLVFLGGLCLVIGVISGSYPAFYLSSISIIQVLRKTGITGGARSLRNGLIVLQFGMAVLLICGSLMVRNQLQYMYNKDMGFSGDQLLFVEASPRDFNDTEIGATRINSFKQNIQGYPFVMDVSASRNVPTNWTGSFLFVRPGGWTGDPLRMRFTYLDANFFGTYDIDLIRGEGFLPDSEGSQRLSAVLNKSAQTAMGLDTVDFPVLQISGREVNVVGVAEDFNFESMRNPVEPTIHFHRSADHGVHRYITLRVAGDDVDNVISTLETEWDQLGAIVPFRYRFADEAVQGMYENEKQFLALISFFTIVSIFIACLGLYGLTVFVIEKKRKEISIRKVVGASLYGIMGLVIRDFAPWILLSLLGGGILAWRFFSTWIEDFHYQAPPDLFIFGATITIVVTLVLVTISYHTIKAGLTNPVKYLREE